MKLGFIGCGNMAQAMITGILTQKVVSPQELIVSNPREEKTAKTKRMNWNHYNNRQQRSGKTIRYFGVICKATGIPSCDQRDQR